jgi:hypothetical protein
MLSMVAVIFGCGGGGGGSSTGGVISRATITGTVAGTTIIATDVNNIEIGRSVAAGSPKTFTLSIPIGNNYKFYFVESENSPNEMAYPLYQGITNVFSFDNAVVVDLGFVDTSSGVAVPTNNPLNIPGVSSAGENNIIPAFLSFAGTYSITTQYDNNIQDGVTLSQSGTTTIEITRIDNSNYSLGLTSSEGNLSVPLVRSNNVARIPTRPYNIGASNLLEFLILSDGNNMVFAFVGQELNDLTDISFNVSNWVRNPQPVTTDNFVGTWNASYYSDPNLRNTIDGFSIGNMPIVIAKINSNTISVNLNGEILALQVVDGRATLISAPVTGVSATYHDFSITTDGTGLSFHIVAAELNDISDVSIAIGLATKQ